MEIMWAQLGFLPGNIYNFMFSGKKDSNSKNFIRVGFRGPNVSRKFWDFATGIDFDTYQMSLMPDSCPLNNFPPIFYVINYFDIHLIVIKSWW